ncbi:hypothetical protein E2C01_039463 [Portunus trituberculatus]|uniref:Uncharacterized protein n=1 Tax=Portunus trituberculatus TaxID=210409 RepID=A0A5B7FLF5_PORTR|nr:hypothetical protein [Portunus trituberculatus]
MQQKCVPLKNSQNRRLLWEAFVEENPPYSDLKMTSRRPGCRMQQKCVPQKNSQNRRLLWEALVEGDPSYSDLKMTSRRPGFLQISGKFSRHPPHVLSRTGDNVGGFQDGVRPFC